MVEDCGHECCLIRTNGYHVHTNEPDGCDRCGAGVTPRVAALTEQVTTTGQMRALTCGSRDADGAARRPSGTATMDRRDPPTGADPHPDRG